MPQLSPEHLFRKAAESPGIYVLLPTYGKAVNVRQRLYQWRKKNREELAKNTPDGIAPPDPYGAFRLVLIYKDGTRIGRGDTPPPGVPVGVRFELVEGEVFDPEGNPLELDTYDEDLPDTPPSLSDFGISDDFKLDD